MAELTQGERLQPSLLDRLADSEPDKKQESRDQRVLSPRKLRESVLRDLGWLLNANNFSSNGQLERYPYVAESVVNFGLPDLAGQLASSIDVTGVERMLRKAICDFEPRLLRNSVKVRLMVDESRMDHNSMTFEIEAELWAQPLPLRMYMKTEVDLESGSYSVQEYAG